MAYKKAGLNVFWNDVVHYSTSAFVALRYSFKKDR